jgi:hypothetical protein
MNNDLDRRVLLGAAGLAGVAAMAGRGAAGPLNPPGGAVAGTGKTTDELWGKIARSDAGMAEARVPISVATTPGDATNQFIIAQPGSYYLTANITGVIGKACIGIAVSGVTIDLNGYMLSGGTSSLAAIRLTAGSASELTIRNGQVRGWVASPAVALDIVPGVQMTDVVIKDSGRVHLGDSALVERCSVLDGRALGLQTGEMAVVRSCVFKECGGTGLQVASGVVESCAMVDNIGAGLLLSARGAVRGCAATGNSGAGFSVGAGCCVVDCIASQNDIGFSLASSIIDRCAAVANATTGISAGTNSVVVRCLAQGHSPGTGVLVTSSDVRVESCQATDNGTGFASTSTGAIFIANTASGSSTANYTVPLGNYGLFVTAVSVAAAVNGSSGGTALGTTDPRANLSY